MAVPAKGPSAPKPPKAPAVGSVVRQGRAVKDKENAPIGGQGPSNQEGPTPPAAKPAKRGRPPKVTKAPLPQTPLDPTQQAVPSVPSAASDSAQSANETELENIALRKKIADMEAQMKSKDTGADTIRTILKPNGEAGDKRNGFVLQDVMELSGSPEKHQIYLAILRSVRRNVARANLDVGVDFRRQDHEKLGQVFKMTRKENPYLDRARFPRDWATSEIVKQYLRNQRKSRVKMARRNQLASDGDDDDGEAAGHAGRGNNGDEDGDEDEDENGKNGGGEDGEGEGEDLEGRRKKRRVDRE